MYARSYYPEREELPKNYSGTAFREEPKEPPCPEPPPEEPICPPREEEKNKNPWELPPSKKPIGSPLASLLGGLPFSVADLFPALFHREGESGEIGTEELLILGVAAILFFSKSGDKRFALLLLVLLFIK